MNPGDSSGTPIVWVEDEDQGEAQCPEQKYKTGCAGTGAEPGPEPEGESMKSDKSHFLLIDFKPSSPLEPQKLPKTEVTSVRGLSMKSDASMSIATQFKDRSRSFHHSSSQEIPDEISGESVPQQQRESDSVFKMLEEDLMTFMKVESQKLQSISSSDHSEAVDNQEKQDTESTEDQEQAKASRETFLKLVLHFSRRRKKDDLADCLWNRTCATECTEKLKSNLRKRFCCVFEGLAKAGNPTLLNQIYTELYITEGGTGEISDEHEVRKIEAASRKQHVQEKTIRQEEIFKASSEKGKPIRTVMTKGVAGIGKTLSTQKFTSDWAENKSNQDIQFIFPFPFRESNVSKDKRFSLVELVHHFFNESKEANLCRFQDFQVVFIFDGSDECRLPSDFHNNEISTDITESSSVDVSSTNLIRGKSLPSARLWLTARPASANQIPPECVDIVTEVKGFTDVQKEEYFKKRFVAQKQASMVICHIRTSKSLHIMCHIPVFCWISATVSENVLKTRQGRESPKTSTELYIYFSLVQIQAKQVKYEGGAATDLTFSPESRKMIESSGKLAFDQLQKGNSIFYESDSKGSGIDVKAASVYSGVFTQIFKEERGIYQDKLFCFIHLSVQEFLAALHIHSTFINSGINSLDEKQPTQRVSLFKKPNVKKLHQTAVEKALQSPNGHSDFVLRILLGLSSPSNETLLRGSQTQIANSSQINQETAEYIRKKINDNLSVEKSINSFHCLNESNDHFLVEEIQQYSRSGSLSTRKSSPAQWFALVFILSSSDKDSDVFDLKKYSASEDAFSKLLPVVKASTKASLNDCTLSEKSCEALSTVLRSESCFSKEVDSSNNNSEDTGMKVSSSGMLSQQCKSESSRLADCDSSKKSCEALSLLLSSKSSSLKSSDLNDNISQDTGFQQFSVGSQSPNCQLQTLSLAACKLSEQSCEMLASALSSPSCSLRSSNMSNNNLGDSGVKSLSVGSENKHCQIETVILCGCQLSESSCKYISTVLSTESFRLRELDMSNNNSKDSGVQQSSYGLGSPNCKSEILRSSGCSVTGKGCGYSASASSSNPFHSKESDSSYNHPGPSGKQMLSSEQKGPPWKSTTLRLDNGGKHRLKADVRKYFCELEVDMNSVNRHLRSSNNNTRIRMVGDEQPYPDHPKRFRDCWQLMCRNGITGRSYWEVESKGGVLISVNYSGIKRSGKSEECRFGRNDQSWTLEYSDVFGFSAWHVNRETTIPPSDTNRIGVYLDFPAGNLSFYDASSETLIHLYTFRATFTEAVYPSFGLWTGASVSLLSSDTT